MLIKLNEEAVEQLQTIMRLTGRTNCKHTVQSMLSQVLNNLRKAKNEAAATNI
ncbi:hypothetical protein [Pseudomonas simiae]|uniref:hypothetical protein n=1 Tax=Pseudomonas simiae TaxID=321846 RepID=UPI003D6AA666